ncbi:MAG: hypothetical protein ACI4PJ_00225 [Acutalibacteraceae bacterium]
MKDILNDTPFSQLLQLAKDDKLPHAILLESSDTENALEFALFLAKIVLCDSLSNGEPCERCSNCIKVNKKSHTDLMVIGNERVELKKAETEKLGIEKSCVSIKVETVRKIREDAQIASCEGKCKFYVINDADNMTIQAQNALIKTLEEPPANVVFIIICKSKLALLSTICSRCQVYSDSTLESGKITKEILETVHKIVEARSTNDAKKIMEIISYAPNDREYLKILLENTLEKLIFEFAQNQYNDEKFEETIDDISYLIKHSDKNININLFKCQIISSLVR